MASTELRSASESSVSAPVTRTRVLLVDDDHDLLLALEQILRAAGFVVNTSRTVRNATRALDEHEFDVIVTDLALGATGGLAFCEAIRRSHPELPVVVLTGYHDAKGAAMALGARRVLVKPVTPDTLIAALREVARQPVPGG